MGVESLFIIGIFMDIIGVFFLSKGLILNESAILTISSARLGWDAPKIANFIKVRTEAIFGLFGIGVGFLLQIIGYFLIITSSVDNSQSYPLRTFIVCLLILILYLAVWRYLSSILNKRMAVKVVQNYEKKNNKDETITEKIRILKAIGNQLGYKFAGEEVAQDQEQILKTFKIKRENLE
ncbi:hypothetical protein KY385_01675 [Candidatus Parcubacteria bacterium]|nr:hypothetical protein [Candidatus Parcubacteria bacterium]